MGYPGARDYGGDNPLLRCAALPFGSHPRPCRDLSARRDAGADAAPVQATAGAGSRGDVRRIAQAAARAQFALSAPGRSEEHTSELQSLMRISYAVFCLKKKTKNTQNKIEPNTLHNHERVINEHNNITHDAVIQTEIV